MAKADSVKVNVQVEQPSIILVSPGGHRYEITVSDHGILNAKYKGKLDSQRGEVDANNPE